MVSGSVLHERECLDELSGIKPSTYRLIPGHGGSRDLALAKLGCQSEDLKLTPWDVGVMRPGLLRFDLRRGRPHSWPCFAFDDGFLVHGGNSVTSFYRCLRGWVDGGVIRDDWPRGLHSILSQR